jgi:hypothetical protein
VFIVLETDEREREKNENVEGQDEMKQNTGIKGLTHLFVLCRGTQKKC